MVRRIGMILFLLVGVLAILKVNDLINIDWIAVLSPLWLPFVLGAVMGIVSLVFVGLCKRDK